MRVLLGSHIVLRARVYVDGSWVLQGGVHSAAGDPLWVPLLQRGN